MKWWWASMVLAASFSTRQISGDRVPTVFHSDLENAFLQIEKHAYAGIELSLAAPEEISLIQLDRLLGQTKVKLSAFSIDPLFESGEGCLITGNTEVRHATIERVKEIMDLASRYKVPLNLGKACSRSHQTEGLSTGQKVDNLNESIADLLTTAAHKPVDLLFEVLNKDDVEFGNSIRDAAALVRTFHSPHLKLTINTSLLGKEILPVYDSLVASADVLAYIHLSDSDRKPMGRGGIEFFKVFRALDQIHYEGWLCVTSFPEPNAGAALDAANFTVIKNAVALRCP